MSRRMRTHFKLKLKLELQLELKLLPYPSANDQRKEFMFELKFKLI